MLAGSKNIDAYWNDFDKRTNYTELPGFVKNLKQNAFDPSTLAKSNYHFKTNADDFLRDLDAAGMSTPKAAKKERKLLRKIEEIEADPTLTKKQKKTQKLEVQEQLDEMKLDTVPPAGADADVSDAMTPKMVKKEKKRLTREMENVDASETLSRKQKRQQKAAIALQLEQLDTVPPADADADAANEKNAAKRKTEEIPDKPAKRSRKHA